ncbi:DNA polymerase/3'-5' exonuclease PolX [Streptomyces sp. RB5]|uniref:DNA polymerase beta n=1 Tax=Streptomyces smaragdinus TaxID=2585196 RepID=A0A7K0CBE9_9ACTN|nr:DNA polymerase/3'-5' exonuclease PolX [Streptomyces smaragdinus]MQY10452.1 DNA polymerase/3'-5' exonuclease PolX [Streptomyces smaragdinus]
MAATGNKDIAAVLQEYADLLAITGGDAFKARAYERAARAVGGHPAELAGLGAKALTDIPGVGKSIAGKVAEYLRTGTVTEIDELRERIPAGVRELTRVPALGPRKALLLHDELGISSVDELAEAIEGQRLRGLKGFGPKTEEKLLHGIGLLKASGERAPLDTATELAERITAALAGVEGCERCAYAGSLRRMRETVGDIDVLAAAQDSGPLMEAFVALPVTAEVIARGTTKTSIRTTDGIQVDLRVVAPDSWGAAMQYFTGSREHNIRTREIARRRGLKLSEYSLSRVKSGRRVAAEREEDVYEHLGLPWIPPVLREDRGEIEAARDGELPELVTEGDLRGDLHTHTDLTDGLGTLEEMARAAADRGFTYYAVTDHAPDLRMQRMTKAKILAQREQVRALDGTLGKRRGGLRLLHGTELNIDPDGEVDWPADFLAGFDLCVASVHSHFDLPRAAMTRRLVKAAGNPHVHVIGHPTARMLGKRGGIDADWDEVFEACAHSRTALEINAQPHRLDLPDELILRARRHGVLFSIDSDAHSVPDLAQLRYGVGTARRGWVTKAEVINTWTLTRLRAFLRRG